MTWSTKQYSLTFKIPPLPNVTISHRRTPYDHLKENNDIKNKLSLTMMHILNKSRTRAKEAHTAGAYPGFRSMKQLRVLLLPPGRDASPSQAYLPAVLRLL